MALNNPSQDSDYYRIEGRSFVFTGRIPGMTRDRASQGILARGGSVSSTVRAYTDILIYGEAPGGRKWAAASALGVQKRSYEWLLSAFMRTPVALSRPEPRQSAVFASPPPDPLQEARDMVIRMFAGAGHSQKDIDRFMALLPPEEIRALAKTLTCEHSNASATLTPSVEAPTVRRGGRKIQID